MRREVLGFALLALTSCASSVGVRGDAAGDDAARDTLGDIGDAGLDAPSDAGEAGLDAPGDNGVDGARDVTVEAPPRDARPADCDLATAYTFGLHGGFSFFEYEARLAPGRSFSLRRVTVGWGPDLGRDTCETTLQRCGASDATDLLSAVLDALEAPDVVAAFERPPGLRYGDDPTVHDQHIFDIERSDGRGFFVGSACGAEPSCRDLTPGLARLRDVFVGVLVVEGRRPECGLGGVL